MQVAFGTAQLFGLADPNRSRLLLEEAWRCGVRRFDTAPSYGGGRSEPAVGAFVRGRPDVELVTTKVGLRPSVGSRPTTRVAVDLAKRILPGPLQQRLRRTAASHTTGRFAVPDVQAGVHSSLRHLDGRLDRLLLHEVQAADVTDELLGLLDRFLADGDVEAVGIATANEHAAAASRAGGGRFTVAHLAVGPFQTQPTLDPSVTIIVGHGLLGPGGAALSALQRTVAGGGPAARRWADAVAGTAWAADGGLSRALLARATRTGVEEVIVATTRPERVEPTVRAARGDEPLPAEVGAALDDLVGATTTGDDRPR